VIACNKNLVPVIKFAKPLNKIRNFLAGARKRHIARMNDEVGSGKVVQRMVAVVGIRNMNDAHIE
jgi:hypothetical protein